MGIIALGLTGAVFIILGYIDYGDFGVSNPELRKKNQAAVLFIRIIGIVMMIIVAIILILRLID